MIVHLILMGTVQSIEIPSKCIPVTEKVSDDESPIYRNMHCFMENGGDFIATFRNQPESRTIIDILRCSSVKWANYDCVGERVINADGTPGPYRYISYKQFYEKCLAFGRGLLSLGLERGDRVGIYSVNSQWWQTIAFGAWSVGMIIVPVYDSLGKDASQYIINHAETKVVFCSNFKYPAAVQLVSECPCLEKICVMADVVPATPTTTIPVMSCKSVLEAGEKSSDENQFAQPEDTAVIMYTSGSTGTPKGCVLQHQAVVAGSAGLGCVNMSSTPSDTFLSFLPLAHIYAMSVELMMYATGARVAFARGTVRDLLDDIAVMQPTIMVAVPRVLNRVAENMQMKIAKLPNALQTAIEKAIAHKSACVKSNRPHSLMLDAILFAKFRAALGGRLRLIVNGGAPITTEVFDFLAATVTPNIIQGYGLTEVCAGLAVQELPVYNPQTVGPSSIACEVKLRKVEGADYDPNGEIPTGELMVRGPILFKEYYKQPKLTEDAFFDGWFATGDVVKITPEGQLQIIDRAKQLVKLSQGEYLSLTTLTEAYSKADGVSFIYVYADPMHDQPLAVVIPKKEKIAEWEAKGISNICESEVVKEEMVNSLLKVFQEKKLRGFERITHVVIDTVEPTIENGMLTPSMKPQFASLKRRYVEDLENLYMQIEQKKSVEAK